MMNPVLKGVCLGVVFVLAGCSSTGGMRGEVHTEESKALESLVSLPLKVNKLSIQDRHVYDDPAAGIQYRYAGELVYYIDVFVYPVDKQYIPLLLSSNENELIVTEHGQFRASLDYAVSQGLYDSASVVEEKLEPWSIKVDVDGEPVSVQFLVSQGEYQLQTKDGSLVSFVALSEFNGHFVKIRLTHPGYSGLREEMSSFTKSIFRALYYRNKPLISALSFENDGQEVLLTCLPGESLGQCVGRGLLKIAPKKEEDLQ